jgi:hypothetical protein
MSAYERDGRGDCGRRRGHRPVGGADELRGSGNEQERGNRRDAGAGRPLRE